MALTEKTKGGEENAAVAQVVKAMAEAAAHPAKAATAAPEAPRKPRPLNENRLFTPGAKQNVWVAHAERGTSVNDILNPEYWAHVARKFTDFDKIVVKAEDRSYYCELIVFTAASNWAEVQMMGEPVFRNEGTHRVELDDFEIVDLGIHLKWGVKARKDNRIVKGDGSLTSKEMAETWLRDWRRIVDKERRR